MKAKFLALAALVLGLASCQTDTINGVKVDANGEAPVTIQVGLPEEATRAAGNNSGIGAIGNVDLENSYDIRFILEVYDANDALAKERQVVSGDKQTATFSLRLVPGRDYKFVAWADFVKKGSKADLHYNTHGGDDEDGLKENITLLGDHNAMDESRDAYTDMLYVEKFDSKSTIDMTLTRPFAKLRVVANDMKELYSDLVSATVTYSVPLYTSFNALEEKPYDPDSNVVKNVDFLTMVYTNEENPRLNGEQTLYADYLFGAEGNKVHFTLDVVDGVTAIPTINFNTNIPVERNHLTTIYGPVLTDANNVTVEIQDSFENYENPEDKPYYVEIISGVKDQTMELTEGSYLFEDVTFNVENDAAIVVKSGNVVMDLMGVMNINAKAGIVVEDGATLTINGVGVADTRGAVRAGNLIINASNGSAIGGNNITINNLAGLTAKAGDAKGTFGIGAIKAEVEINNTKINYVSGAYVQPLFVNDTKYGKSEPEGASAIGGSKVTLDGVELVKAEGGSKAAAIGNRFWENTEVIIKNSTLGDVFGGNASAAIGGSRVKSDVSADNKQEVKITIENSTIKNAVGGQYGAGIGFGYDTYCAANDTNCVNNIVIIKSTITTQGGMYAAGIGTGFHTAALTGSIDAESVINATCGEDFYKNTYTAAQNIGYGIVDPEREFKDCNVTFTVAGNVISRPSLPVVGENGTIVEGLGKDIENENQYYASEPEALTYIADQVNEGNGNFNEAEIVLSNDIDLSQFALTRSASNWTPIGTEESPFTGTFDGNGYSLKNLNIVESEAKEGKAYIGFFGYAKDATIKNVTFENVNINIPCLDIDHSQGHIGAVAGSLEGTSTIENVTVKGDIKVESTVTANGASRVAVVAGGNSYGNVTMKNVHVIANEGSYLKANNNVGALAGQLQGKSVFENCSSNIDVTGTKFFAGGIIGLAAGDQLFTNCHTTGNVTITAGREGRAHDHYRVGGIAGGWADGAKNVCTLVNCSYTGKLSGTNADGSVVEVFDYAGYVGRGYTLNNCQGSKVVIDGVEYVQACNTAAEAGIYYVNGELVISTASALKVVATRVNNGTDYYNGKTIVLGADIDLNNEEWTPIGTETQNFEGNFDGNDKTIKNLKITEHANTYDGYAYAGLFGVTSGSEAAHNYIKNIVIENVTISTTGQIAAAAVAYPYYTDVENITVKGNVSIKGGNYTSGVVSYTRRCVVAKNLSINANAGSVIEGNQTVGGVISDIQTNGGLVADYSNFAAKGLTIKGVQNVGGISGIISDETLNGATVKNVIINCDDVRSGIISGSVGMASVVNNVVVENVFGADNYVGATYDSGKSSKVTIDGVVYEYQADGSILVNGCQTVAYGVIIDSEGAYCISNKAGMFWFANEVNVNKNAFKGKTVKLAADINLNNELWTPVGQTGATTFNGVFDGQNNTISNLNVNSDDQTGKYYSSGLFGWVESHTAGHGHIKNVKINGATIVGHHNCGALVGYITQETALVENCHVTGATVSCTYANGDADGDKAGALIGNATVATPVKGCTAANSTVSAGRDAGQVIGAGKEANVTGCSATNVTVSANGTGTGANVRNEVIGRLLN